MILFVKTNSDIIFVFNCPKDNITGGANITKRSLIWLAEGEYNYYIWGWKGIDIFFEVVVASSGFCWPLKKTEKLKLNADKELALAA